jgi:hypothetical protein
MKRILLILLSVFILTFPAAAQDEPAEEKPLCPTLEMSGPPGVVKPGEPMKFTFKLNGEYDPEKLEIDWKVENGNILSGQGTTVLEVFQPEEGQVITATVSVKTGAGCELTDSESGLTETVPKARLHDEYGAITDEDIWARTDALLVELSNDPNTTAYIVIYGSERQIKKRETLLRDYVRMRQFDASRIVYVIGGKENKIRTRVWIVPPGADPSTID